MQNLDDYHALEIRFLGATNHKGSRVKITSHRFKQSVTIPYNHEFNGICDIAQNYLESKDFNLIGKAESKEGYLLISSTFESLK